MKPFLKKISFYKTKAIKKWQNINLKEQSLHFLRCPGLKGKHFRTENFQTFWSVSSFQGSDILSQYSLPRRPFPSQKQPWVSSYCLFLSCNSMLITLKYYQLSGVHGNPSLSFLRCSACMRLWPLLSLQPPHLVLTTWCFSVSEILDSCNHNS